MRVQLNEELLKLVKKNILEVVACESRETEENTILTLELKEEFTQVGPQLDPLGKPLVCTSKFVQVISEDIVNFQKDFKNGKYEGTMKLDVTQPKGYMDRSGEWKWTSPTKIQLCTMYLSDFGRSSVSARREKGLEAYKALFGGVPTDKDKHEEGNKDPKIVDPKVNKGTKPEVVASP
jgi:hypothetical protein